MREVDDITAKQAAAARRIVEADLWPAPGIRVNPLFASFVVIGPVRHQRVAVGARCLRNHDDDDDEEQRQRPLHASPLGLLGRVLARVRGLSRGRAPVGTRLAGRRYARQEYTVESYEPELQAKVANGYQEDKNI